MFRVVQQPVRNASPMRFCEDFSVASENRPDWHCAFVE
jgi:hypothetical protein